MNALVRTRPEQPGYVFKTDHYRKRAAAASDLCNAIADCDPADACEIMGAALADLSAGMPMAPLFGHMDQATFWASLASRPERKAYALATFLTLTPKEQAGFLAYVQRSGAA